VGDEPKRLGTTGDFGFLIAALTEEWKREGLRVHDFVPKIGDTFVHDAADMKLISDAAQKRIEVIRWGGPGFEKLILRP
jgi:hypothetical protein